MRRNLRQAQLRISLAWACCRSLKRPSGVKNSKADRVSFQALSAAIA